ncbi:hypothetical protein [Amycolatopsis sp. MtRt-6]|uniref:hypothetical protein n=1 Tax=Amycolatopsis sp. MtRt-6 TaxID=2792782 RepID=UPI001A8CD3DE|nr:hypothetical protein [Amycolatopsis sp. MtRt-6]
MISRRCDPKSGLLGGDAGDVTYLHFLGNGRTATAPTSFAGKPGQRIRLRLVNAGAEGKGGHGESTMMTLVSYVE